jgi:hypothetical protein
MTVPIRGTVPDQRPAKGLTGCWTTSATGTIARLAGDEIAVLLVGAGKSLAGLANVAAE